MGVCCSKYKKTIYLSDECPICFYQITNKNYYITPCCLTLFCKECIMLWKKKNNTCPWCRNILKNKK